MGCRVDVAVAVAGGNGTISEAVNGLGRGAPPIGIIPLGTANVLAIEVGLPVRAGTIAATIANGEATPVTTGLVNDRRFILMAGIGLDASVVETIDLARKRRLGKMAYVWQALREGLRYPFPRFDVEIDGRRIVAPSLIVANGRHYAGSFVCAPDAGLERDRLEACAFTRFGAVNALRYGLALTSGLPARLPDVVIQPAARIALRRLSSKFHKNFIPMTPAGCSG